MSKYKNIKTTVDGITFDSRAEASYYKQLKLLKKSGVVKEFERQKRYTLFDKLEFNGRTYRKLVYIADFVVTYRNGDVKVVDVKGMETQLFKLKARLFIEKYQVPLVLAKLVRGRFYEEEY